MMRLLAYFTSVGAGALGLGLLAIQTVDYVRDGSFNPILVLVGAGAFAFGAWSIFFDKRRNNMQLEKFKAMDAGRLPEERRYTEAGKRGGPARGAPEAVVADAAPRSSEGLAPIDRIIDAERSRAELFWRTGLADLREAADRAGIGDGALILLDAATKGMAQTMAPRQVARLLHEIADEIAAAADRPPAPAKVEAAPAPAADATKA